MSRSVLTPTVPREHDSPQRGPRQAPGARPIPHSTARERLAHDDADLLDADPRSTGWFRKDGHYHLHLRLP